jgi:hypothetical protein
MKKVLATILAVIYLSTSIGATVHFHYCMGKLVSWGLTDQHGKDCRFCGMPKKTATEHCIAAQQGCCADQHQHVQGTQEQKVNAAANQYTSAIFAIIDASYLSQLSPAVSPVSISSLFMHAPPHDPCVPAYLLNRNFRI